MNEIDKFPDLEILSLRQRVKELEQKLNEAQAILREHDLLDATSNVSAEENVCIAQIAKFKELSDKNVPFQTEDVKNFEVLVRTLLSIRGKAMPAEDKRKKKTAEKPDLAKLLKIAQGSEE